MAVPHSADIFQAKSESLATLLPDIHAHRTALPNFQREWVWDVDMVVDLIVSIANRYPAGSLLTMPTANSKFALRPFSGSGSDLTTDPALLVLDGQQRLTSLYQSLFSKEGVRSRDGNTYHIYMDVKSLMAFDTETTQTEEVLKDCLISVQQKPEGERIYYRSLQDSIDVTTREHEMDAGLLPLHTVFHPEELYSWRTEYQDRNSNHDYDQLKAIQAEWDAEVGPWIQRIRDYRFPVIELNKDMALQAICHIFEKVNSTGVPLTVFELATAILWADEFHLNTEWDKTRNELQSNHILRMQRSLEGTQFLQVISLLATLERKRESPNMRVAVSMRREALLKLKKKTMTRWWSLATQGYRDASRFMLQEGIIAERILPYSTMLVPLAAIMAYLREKLSDAEFGGAWPKIQQWYWCSVFSNRYSGPGETLAATDFEQMVQWIETGEEPEAIRSFYFDADRLLEVNNIRNAVYKGVLCLLVKNGAKDFSGEGPLSTQLFFDMRQDHHHIFPRSVLERWGVEWRLQNCVVNRTLIGAATNRSIGGRPPSSYINTMRERLGEERTNEILRSHLIDPHTMEEDDFHEFLLARREKIKLLIETACGKSISDFSDGQKSSLPAQIQRVADSVRDVELSLRELIVQRLGNDWSQTPGDAQGRITDRIRKKRLEDPGFDENQVADLAGKLGYADLRELETIITSKLTWHHFSEVFGSKEMLSTRFRLIAPLRNASAHHREISELEKADAEAAVMWFESAITRARREAEVDPVTDAYDEEYVEEEEYDETAD